MFSHMKLEFFVVAVNTLKVYQLKIKFQVHSNIMYSIYSLYHKGLFIIHRYTNYFTYQSLRMIAIIIVQLSIQSLCFKQLLSSRIFQSV